jgi:hypothetical protein
MLLVCKRLLSLITNSFTTPVHWAEASPVVRGVTCHDHQALVHPEGAGLLVFNVPLTVRGGTH